MPLQYSPLTWDATFQKWREIPWLNLGVFQRADWIANALVVMPSAFLLSGSIDYGRASRAVFFVVAPIVALSMMGIVVGIELAQVWFPPRTVSQNDIFAGCIGAVTGVAAWGILGRPLAGSFEAFKNQPTIALRIRWLALMACIGCFLYCVYPFDFVLSRQEWLDKQSSGRMRWDWGWGSQGMVSWAKGVLVSFAKTVPFAMFFGLGKSKRTPWILLSAIALVMEVIQIPIFSKSFSPIELVASFAGAWCTYGLVVSHHRWLRWFRHPAWWGIASVVCAIGVFIAFNMRFDRILTDTAEIQSRWKEFFLPPLIRYYYTSEYSALSNLAGKLMLFGLLGCLMRLWEYHAVDRKSASVSGARPLFKWGGILCVIGLAVSVEICQIYLPPLIADATDVAVYVSGYFMAYFGTGVVVNPNRNSNPTR